MRLRVAGLWRHPKSKMFWFRMGVPERYRARVGKREWKETLGTKVEAEARALHAQKLVEVHDLMRRLDAADTVAVDDEADKIVSAGFDALARSNVKAHEIAFLARYQKRDRNLQPKQGFLSGAGEDQGCNRSSRKLQAAHPAGLRNELGISFHTSR
ncbi:MAG: hypothetical protein IE932_00040 [Sphingopyxis terrae]|nr:hypothetical protein [Sphingopyxis terrae]